MFFFCYIWNGWGDSGYSMHIYKSVNISTRTVIKNSELLKFAPGHV